MAEENANNDVSLSAVIKEQSQTIETLVKQVQENITQSPAQPIYATTPQKTAEEKPPNYLAMAGIALAIWFLFFKKEEIKLCLI